jgi:hypothetical protein
MHDAAPNGGASLSLLAEGPGGIATVAPAPFTIPAGQMVADVVLHAAAPGTMRYTPLTRGLPGTGSTFVIDSALLTLQVDTSNNGCDGPCSVQEKTSAPGRHVSPATPYNAPQRTTASRAVLAQQRRATDAVLTAASSARAIAKASGQFYFPPPGDPNNIILGAGQYLPTSGSRGDCYYRCGAVLSLPNRTFAGVHATLTVDDPTIARAEDGATVPLDYAQTFLNVSALAVGTTVLHARRRLARGGAQRHRDDAATDRDRQRGLRARGQRLYSPWRDPGRQHRRARRRQPDDRAPPTQLARGARVVLGALGGRRPRLPRRRRPR